MAITISASPNSTRPRSSRRFTIARARNSICRTLFDMDGQRILKQHLTPLTGGGDAVDTQPCDEDPLVVLDESLRAVDEGNDLRSRPHRSKRDRPNVHPSPHRADAITRPVEIRRLPFDAVPLDRASVAVEAAWHLLFLAVHVDLDLRRHEHVLEIAFPLATRERVRDTADDLGVVDEHTPRPACQRDVDVAGLLVPAHAVALVQGDAFGNEDTLDLHVILSAAKDPLGHGDHARRGSLAAARDDTVGNRLREENPILLPRLPRLLHAHDRAVLPPHRPPPLAVDHVSSRVTRSGAKESTTSSCPSREQTTPG